MHIIACLVILILQIINLQHFLLKKENFILEPNFLVQLEMFTWNFHLNICELILELMLVSCKNYSVRGFSWTACFPFFFKRTFLINYFLPSQELFASFINVFILFIRCVCYTSHLFVIWLSPGHREWSKQRNAAHFTVFQVNLSQMIPEHGF